MAKIDYIYTPNKHYCYALKGKEMLYNDDIFSYSPTDEGLPGERGAEVRGKFTSSESLGGLKIETICIPDKVVTNFDEPKERYVTSIGNEGFYNEIYRSDIKRVILPPHLLIIGESAFAESGIEEIIIPDSVIAIRMNAFGTSALKKATIGSEVTVMEDMVFMGCENLKTVIMKGEIPPAIDALTFPETIEEIIVPKGCKSAYMEGIGWEQYADKIKEL